MQTAAVIKIVANCAAADANVDRPQSEEGEEDGEACNVAAAASTHVELMCHASSVSQSVRPPPLAPPAHLPYSVCLFVSLSLSLALFELCFQCCRAQRVAAFCCTVMRLCTGPAPTSSLP